MRSWIGRWLARPSTLQVLRGRCQSTARIVKQWKGEQDEVEIPADTPTERQGTSLIRRISHVEWKADELLGVSMYDYSLRMSMLSGVSLIQSDGEQKGTFNQTKYQAAVEKESQLGKLLVDQDEHRENYKLWTELLLFRRRIDGVQGVIDIWTGLRNRDIDLPTEGEEAAVLWDEFIQAAASRHDEKDEDSFLKSLTDYAIELKQRTGRHYGLLHRQLVTQLFPPSVGLARKAHARLADGRLTAHGRALKDIVPAFLQHHLPDKTFQDFKRLYVESEERDIYDLAIPLAIEICGYSLALKWHKLLLGHGDSPSAEVSERPEVQHLFELANPGQRANVAVQANTIAATAARDLQRKPDFPPLTRASMNTLVGDVHGIKEKEVSDGFIAKMLATTALSLDLVIRGLGFFAIAQLGPLALRELAVRCGSAVELCNRLNELARMKIGLADAAYCRLVKKMAADGHTEQFSTLLAMDQHPESFSDMALQEALLQEYLDAERWAEANVTMTCLSLAGAPLKRRGVNLLAQHYLRTKQWRLVASTMATMQAQRLAPTSGTLYCLHRYLLPERRRGKQPFHVMRKDVNRPPFEPLNFVTNVCMFSQELKQNVPSRLWVELLKRYGMAHRFPGVERLVLFLAGHKSLRRKTRYVYRDGRKVTLMRKKREVEEIFSRQMVQAIFTWGFNAAVWRRWLGMPWSDTTSSSYQTAADSQETVGTLDVTFEAAQTQQHQPWSQGLRLLNRLKGYGVAVPNNVVRQAFRIRMWILFGPGMSYKSFNELARRVNNFTLAEYVRQGAAAYERSLVPNFNPRLLEDDTQGEALLKLAVFGEHRQGSSRSKNDEEKRRHFIDVGAWTSDLLAGGDETSSRRSRMVLQRERRWRNSPFRIERPAVVRPLVRAAEVARRRKTGFKRLQSLPTDGLATT